MQNIFIFQSLNPIPLPLNFQNFSIHIDYDQQLLDTSKKLCKKIKRRHKISSWKSENQNNLEGEINCGHWTQKQNQSYYYFLTIHKSLFFIKARRRTQKIFKIMSQFVTTRSADQCRSHHQKMQKKYGSFNKILYNLKLSLTLQTGDQKYMQQKQLEGKKEVIETEDIQGQGNRMEEIQQYEMEESKEYFEIPCLLQPIYRMIEQKGI